MKTSIGTILAMCLIKGGEYVKRVLASLFIVVMLGGIGTAAHASYFQDDLDPVCFFVVDDPLGGNDTVTLEYFGNNVSDWNLEYRYGSVGWTSLASSGQVAIPASDRTIVYYRLVNSSSGEDTKADLVFSGADDGDLWNSVAIYWGDVVGDYSSRFQVLVAGDDDNVAPVPIPQAVLLLGSGVFGLLVFGRRRAQSGT